MNGALTPPSQSPSPYYVLKDLCSDNIEYFKEDQSEGGQKLYVTLISIFNSLDPLICSVDDILSKASKYDFDPSLPANGYRSFVFIVEKIVQHSIKVCQQIVSNRSSYFFRKGSYARELDDCCEVISSLSKLLSCLQKLMSWNTSGGLFPTDHHLLEELLVTGGVSINQYCFYGRHLGFQFCESIAIILKALAILMASFSEVYYGGNRIMDSLWNGGKYLIDTELRAKRIVNISQYASAEFCKTFWFLGEMELMQRLPNFVSASLVVNKLITIEPEPFSLTSLSGQIIDIPIPSAHKGHAPLSVRLLSSVRRFGMLNETDGKEGIKMASKGLIFHCHGGGFVAQSSRSHETYLRQWASKIDCPILSVDYSLAPEAPYPRALEEVFFAYCWTISNAHILGSTAERIILAGDSAGANLNIGLTMKCIEYGIRLPDGLFLAYAPVVLSFAPSPSRTLCLLDPLLPFGFLLNCSKAYACPPDIYTSSPSHEDKLRRNINKQERNKCDISLPQNGGEVGNASEDFTEIPIDGEEIPARPVLLELPQSQTGAGILSRIASVFANKFSISSKNDEQGQLDDELEKELQNEALLPCPLDLMNFEVPHDPYLSPFYASDEVLKKFPPVTLLSLHLDPFLDDCVEFAKRLKNVGNDVHLEVLDGLSHGFLNFSMLSKEAHEGSNKCITWINKMLSLNPTTTETPVN